MCRLRQTRTVHRRDGRGTTRPRLPDDRSGAAALEYALVGPVFLALLFFVIETAWQLTVNLALHIGVAAGSRYAVTGTGLADGTREAAVRDRVISASGGILKSANLKFDPEVSDRPTGFVAGGGAVPLVGASRQFVRYRVRYTQDFITPVSSLSRMLGGGGAAASITHAASLVAQNEPF